jgi:UDP-N-acetylmuramoylalanine--D-glutamate ligase
MEFSSLNILEKQVKNVFIMGECREKIGNAIAGVLPFTLFNSFDDAVNTALKTAEAKDIVLLSPGCASMDMFKNYKERGKKFKQIIINLTNNGQ